MTIDLTPLTTALRFAFEKNHRVPASRLPGQTPVLRSGERDTLSSTWLGHSTLLISLGKYRILTDPVLVNKVTPVGPSRFSGTLPASPGQLPPLDLVLISHDHYDHLNRPSIVSLKNSTEAFAVPRGVGKYLRDWGVPKEKIMELNWWESCAPLPGLQVTATPAQHFSGRGLFDRNRTLWASWVIRSRDFRLFFSGDSGYFNGFAHIGQNLGPFDVTFLECGAYDRAWHEVHMLPEETVQAHLDLGGGILHPVHWSTFNLALHPWYAPMERLTKAAARAGIVIATPRPGQALELSPEKGRGSLGSRWWKPAMDRQQKKRPG